MSPRITRTLMLAALALSTASSGALAARVETGLVKGKEGQGQMTACFCDDGMRAIDWRPANYGISPSACRNACAELGKNFTAPLPSAPGGAKQMTPRGWVNTEGLR